jgi:peptidoglycan/LPS O-acetylase OafA/YrhL
MTEERLRAILLVLAVYHLLLGALMFFAPGAFYDTLGKFPPENDHYIKDVATFYLALGAVFLVSVRRRSWRMPVLVFAALEYALHAVNHLVDVQKAGSDAVGWFDFFALAAIALVLAALASIAWRVQPERAAADDEQPLGPQA